MLGISDWTSELRYVLDLLRERQLFCGVESHRRVTQGEVMADLMRALRLNVFILMALAAFSIGYPDNEPLLDDRVPVSLFL